MSVPRSPAHSSSSSISESSMDISEAHTSPVVASFPGLHSQNSSQIGVVKSSSQLRIADSIPTRPPLSTSRSYTKSSNNGDGSGFQPGLQGISVADPEKVEQIRRWILGFVLVDFDLDKGPVASDIYPPVDLPPKDLENIAFSSFPDSPQFDEGSDTHSFRIRHGAVSLSSTVLNKSNGITASADDGFIYGFAHFSQRKDPSSPRGYRQRSIVILTYLPYPALFYQVLDVLGPLFWEHGTPMLESASQNIASWSDPLPGTMVELGFLGTVFDVEIPRSVDEQQIPSNKAIHGGGILALSTPLFPPLLLVFESCLPNLWSIWECVVLCEPILLFGPSPSLTSQAVWWLRDLLRPIPLAGDIRPYITIQDTDLKSFINKMPPKSGLLAGVTNPFIAKTCSHWPHVLSLGSSPKSSKKNGISTPGPAPGWKTKTHNRYISKDRQLLKRLEDGSKSDSVTQLNLTLELRRHFHSRTTAFLVPLNRYINTLIPGPSSSSPSFGASSSSSSTISPPDPPKLKPFNTPVFLASLKTHGSPLPFRSGAKQKEFYERWLKTPSFHVWLAKQEDIVHEALCNRDRAAV